MIEITEERGYKDYDVQCMSADIPELPTDVKPGAVAVILDTSAIYMFSPGNGGWVKFA